MTTNVHNGVAYTYTPEVDQDLSSLGINIEAEIKSAIDEAATTMVATLYSKPNCPFCVRAKMLLQNEGVVVNELSAVDHRDRLIQEVTEVTGHAPKTVPQIWLGGQYIGGFTELEAHFKAL